MQYGLPDSAKSSIPRAEHDDAVAIEPGSAFSLVAEMVGERKRVLDLGCGDGRLARLLAQRECDIVGVDINPAAVEEARRFCTHAIVADIDGASLPELIGDREFDVVVLGSVLQRLRQPTRLLDSVRSILRDGGLVVAVAPNVAHGAIRLSLLQGQFDGGEGGGQRLFTAKTIDELFLSAGYRIESIARTKSPIFDGSELVPQLQRDDFDPAIVAEIERDPEAQTLQYVVRAVSLSNDAKHRAISKRFLTANTELASLRTRLEKRDREIERLNHLQTGQAADEEAQVKIQAAITQRNAYADQVATLRSDLARSENLSVAQAAELQLALDAAKAELVAATSLVEKHRAHAEALRNERDQIMGEAAGLRTVITARESDIVELKDAIEQHRAHGNALRAERDREMGDSAALRTALAELQANEATLNERYEHAKARMEGLENLVVDMRASAKRAAGENEATVALLREDRDRAVAEILALQLELEAAKVDVRDATDLLQVADDEIARLDGQVKTYLGIITELEREAVRKKRSAGLLADQLYDEIRALGEARAIARAQTEEAREFLKRDTAALHLEVERLEEEAQSLRLKLVNRARAHDRFESETKSLLAEYERDRDAEREARIAGDELHDSLRINLALAREELETAHAQIEATSAQFETANRDLEGANILVTRLEAEREAEAAARAASEEQHATLSEALIDARHRANDLKDRFDAIELRLVDQTQALLDQTRAESERTAILIDTVHTSVFWRIKGVFRRMLGRRP